MLDLRKETDIGILRKAALLLESDNQFLRKALAEFNDALAEIKGQQAEQLALRLAELEQQLRTRNRMLFGDRSEKRPARHVPDVPPEQTTEKRGHGRREQPNLPVFEMEHELPAGDRGCKACGGQLEPFGDQVEESEEIDILPPQIIVVRHKRHKYRCRCNAQVVTAPGPVKLQPGSRYSVAFAVQFAAEKYLDHIPLERQVRRFGRDGLEIDSQTLWDQIDQLAKVLAPTYEAIARAVLESPVVCADETSWRLMGQKGAVAKRWWVWGVANPSLVAYRFLDSRSQEAAAKILGGYCGIVMADGYGVYQALSGARQMGLDGQDQPGGFKLVNCWAHVRRKFVDIEASFPESATQILDLIGALYSIEKKVEPDLPESEGHAHRAHLRDAESREVIDRIADWLRTTPALPASSPAKAMDYMRGLWQGLVAFLEDPRIPLDNNLIERELRPVVLGRKNHLGSRSSRGTEVAATLYTLFESARMSGKDPRAYVMALAYRSLASPGYVLLPADFDTGPPE